MLFSIIASALIASVALAQNETGIPACGIACTIQALPGSSCTITNITCLCTDPIFASQFLTCQKSTCSSSDFLQAQSNGNAQCIADGHPLAVITSAQAATGSLNGTVTSNSTNPAPAAASKAPAASSSTAPVSSASASASVAPSAKSSAQTVVVSAVFGLAAAGFAVLM